MELGGNNAIIISNHADLDIAIPAIVFGAVGTTGQRCTSTRRLIIHEDVYENVRDRLIRAYEQVAQKIGNPLDEGTLVGPMVDPGAALLFTEALEKVKDEGGRIFVGAIGLKIQSHIGLRSI